MSLLSPSQQEARRRALISGLTTKLQNALQFAQNAILAPSQPLCRNAALYLKGTGDALANPVNREVVGDLGRELGLQVRAFGLRMSALADLHEANSLDETARLPELTEHVRIQLQRELESSLPFLQQFAQNWLDYPDLDPEPVAGLEIYDERVAA